MWTMINNSLTAIILMSTVSLFGKIVLNYPFKKITLKNISFFAIICIIQTISFLVFDGTIKTLVMLVNNAIFYKYIFNISPSKSLFLSFLHMILLILPEITEIIITTKLLRINEDFFYNSYSGSIIANITISILFIIFTYLIRKILRRIISIKIEDNIKIIIYYVLTFICISTLFYRTFYNVIFDINFAISIFIIIAFLIILISLIKQTLDNTKLTKEYDKLLEFMTTYENEIEKQRILRHETKNEILTIRAKIYDKQENKEIINYIDEILKDKIKVNQEKYAKFGYLPPNGIKGLCYFKVQEAENKGINVSLNISKKIKESTIYSLNTKQQREFGRILGVLLDNAIESSEKSTKKQLGIETYVNKNKEYKMIISNTYDNKIDNNKIGKEKFSTKGKNRGHGLLLVKHIITENKIFELKTEVQNNIYSQIIIIKKV